MSLLEDLVPLFDARYDTHDGDLLSFVDDVLIPEVEVVLNRLKQEDETAYTTGRRGIGVVMTEERGSNSPEARESDSGDECESGTCEEEQ